MVLRATAVEVVGCIDLLVFLENVDYFSHLGAHLVDKGSGLGHLVQVLLELPLGRAVVDQDQLEHVHAIQVDGQLEHRQVESIQARFPSLGCRTDIINFLRHRVGRLILLGPLLLYPI